MKSLLAAFRFLTILPLPGTWGTAEADLAASVPFFPVVGLVLGALAAGLAWALPPLLPPLLTAALLLVALLAFSGCLHLDGLADTADGFLSSRSRERMLEIMKDSRIGAMGVAAVVVVLLTKFAALAGLAEGPSQLFWPAVLLMPLAGRCAMVVHMAWLPYARESGLARVFYQRRSRLAAVWAMGVLAAVAWYLLGRRGLVAVAAVLVSTLALAVYVQRKLGGTTGDTFGALCEVIELVPAVTLSMEPVAAWEN